MNSAFSRWPDEIESSNLHYWVDGARTHHKGRQKCNVSSIVNAQIVVDLLSQEGAFLVQISQYNAATASPYFT